MSDGTGYSVLEGRVDGRRMVATIREGLAHIEGKDRTPWFLGFSTRLSSTTPEGLPTEEEAEGLNRWEDALDQKIASLSQSIFVGRVTWNGTRELLYYVASPDQLRGEIERLMSEGTLRPFAYRCERDPGWSNVRVYMR